MKGDFKELKVWSKAMQLSRQIYQIARCLPPEERFALSDQMRRSAISIPSNIAEGHGRQSEREFLQFLFISRGSLYELETQLMLCKELYMIDEVLLTDAIDSIVQTKKMLGSLISYIQNIDK